MEVKIAEPNKWRGKHVILWEQEHGPRPKGHKVIFADGNHRNFTPENLILVSNGELLIMNHLKLVTPDAALTKTGRTVAKLCLATAAAKKGKRKKPEPQIIYYDPKTLKVL